MALWQIFLEHGRSFQSINSNRLLFFDSWVTLYLIVCVLFVSSSSSEIFHYVSVGSSVSPRSTILSLTPFVNLLFPFYFICFENAILQIPYSIFSSVYFTFCGFKIIFTSLVSCIIYASFPFISLYHPWPRHLCFELFDGFFKFLSSWSSYFFHLAVRITTERSAATICSPLLFLLFYCSIFVSACTMLQFVFLLPWM